jgi:hypothetical protein
MQVCTNIQFSAQFDKTDSGDDKVDIWLSKNGSNVANTNTEMTLVGNNGKHVAAWNLFVNAAAADYFELCWSSADANVFINYVATQSTPHTTRHPIRNINRQQSSLMTFEMIVWAVGSVASVLGIYMRMEMKLKELDIRVKSLETTDQKMNDKLDRIMELVNEIRLELKDKADR